MKIGIDFGSTYSTLAQYNPKTGDVEPLTTKEGDPASIPSVVSIPKIGARSYGVAAKNSIGKSSVRIFEAFKMLLNEPNREMLRRRGYDDQHTPRLITRYFLEGTLRQVMHRANKESVEKLVICIPEIWSQKLNTLDGRAILRDVLKNEVDIPIGQVQVVTEPEAASAFIAYHYEKETKQNFNGHLLLIDFGGGTLDLTLTQVTSTGDGTMEIGYREGGGAGENHPNKRGDGAVGRAGIAFMQGVVQLAVQNAGLLGPDDTVDYTAPVFVAAVKDLENQLKDASQMCRIEEVFSEYGSYGAFKKILKEEDDLDDPNSYIFCQTDYGAEEVSITFKHLYLAYRDIIEGMLYQELEKINRQVGEHLHEDPCRPAAGAKGDFKIAMVGGFSSFYLVQRQIAEIYNLDTDPENDPRLKNVCADKQEQAIALGAALLAADKVVLQRTARYSIGVCSTDIDGNKRLSYGIKYHQVVKPNTPYYLCRDDSKPDEPGNRQIYGALGGNINSFVIGYSEDLGTGGQMKLKPEMLERLRQLPVHDFWNLAFSMDESDVVTFHIVSRTTKNQQDQPKEIKITLDSYSGMFDLTTVKEVGKCAKAEEAGEKRP